MSSFELEPQPNQPDRYLSYPTHPISDRELEIPARWLDPHYTNGPFTQAPGEGLDIYLSPTEDLTVSCGDKSVEGASYQYSDRLYHSVNGEAHDSICIRAEEKAGKKNTAAYYEAYLQEILNDPTIELVHIVAGVNRGNGFSYRIFGYKTTK